MNGHDLHDPHTRVPEPPQVGLAERSGLALSVRCERETDPSVGPHVPKDEVHPDLTGRSRDEGVPHSLDDIPALERDVEIPDPHRLLPSERLSPGREHRGAGMHQHRPDAQPSGHLRRMLTGSPTERDERVVREIRTLRQGQTADRTGHLLASQIDERPRISW